MTPVERMLHALQAYGCRPQRTGKGWLALCPAHDDRRPSLSVSEGTDGRALVYCFAGCPVAAIVAALALTVRDLMPAADVLPAPRYGPKHFRRPWRYALHTQVNLAVSGQPAGGADLAAEVAQAVRWTVEHPQALERFAAGLGVSADALRRLSVGYSPQRSAWLFPMRDAAGEICGVRLRLANGRKLSIRGGHEGLFTPSLEPAPKGPESIGDMLRRCFPELQALLIPEGPTDTAALLDLGFPAVGRPSCRGGAALVIELCKRFQPRRVVVVSDADTPGRAGAEALARRLRAYVPDVRIIEPPAGVKDIRAWKAVGASQADIQAAIDAAPALPLAVINRTCAKGEKQWKIMA